MTLSTTATIDAQTRLLTRVLPFALFIGALAVRGVLAAPATMPALDARWLYALQVVPTLIALAWFAPRYVELRHAPCTVNAWIWTVSIGAAVFALWITLTHDWMRLGEPAATFVAVDDGGRLRLDLIALRAFGAVLVVPVMEELFWRSFLMRWLDRRDFLEQAPRATSWTALLASSAVFALAHDLWLAGLIAGLAYGLLYMRTGNLWYPIAAHALTNALLAAWVVAYRQWAFW